VNFVLLVADSLWLIRLADQRLMWSVGLLPAAASVAAAVPTATVPTAIAAAVVPAAIPVAVAVAIPVAGIAPSWVATRIGVPRTRVTARKCRGDGRVERRRRTAHASRGDSH
jgi:hypothetical protein